MAAERLIRIPDSIDDQQAAAMMLKGLTAQALLRQVYRVRKTDVLLIHAAAGGVGSILCSGPGTSARRSSRSWVPAKRRRLSRSCGADHVLLSR